MSKNILRKENNLARVLEYSPKKFNLGIQEPAIDFQDRKKEKPNDFRMSDTLRIQTGINQLEAENTNQEIEKRTLEKLKDVQEKAYQEAYTLGLEEGRKEAFQKRSADINAKLDIFEKLIVSVEKMKTEILKQNEAHMIKLLYHMASRLAGREVQVDNQALLNIIAEALQMAQSEENVKIQISPEQFEFFEDLKKHTGREFEFLKKVMFESNDQIKVGGCIVETNYGEIDARFEQRMNKLWETLSEHLYQPKNKIEVA